MKRSYTTRGRLLGSTCALTVLMASGAAMAQEVTVTDANALITANQYNNAFGTPTSMSIVSANGTIDDSFVGVLTDTFTGSTVGTMNNTVASSVLGNEAVLSIVSTVNTDTAGGAGADVTAGQIYDNRIRADADADANLAIGVVQGNNEVISSATTTNTIASVNTGAVGTSTIDVTGNTQRASGALNLAQNTITTTANGSDMTAGIASSQVNEDSSLTLTSASLAGIRVGDAATGSTLTVSGNTQSAFGAGNSATNTINATVTNAELTPVVGSSLSSATDIGGGMPGTSAMGEADVLATYAIANAQTQDDVTLRAITDGAGNGFELSVAGNVGTSTLVNDSNTASSSIRGNEATSTVNLTLTNVATGTFATSAPGTVAAIGNSQNVDGTISATTMGVAGLAVETAIGGTLDDSTVSTSSNTVSSSATANTSANRIVVQANDVDTGLTATPGAVVSPTIIGVGTSTAAFAVSSTQQAQGSVTASLVDNPTAPTSGARIETSVDGNISESTIASNLNTLRATATGNEGVNQIALSATNLDTTAALLSVQSGNAAASATSTMEVYAPAATLDSTVEMNRNVNQAVATLNTVNNAVSVTAANITSASGGANAVLDSTITASANTQGATADNVLNNVQIASTSVAATANTQVVNGDGGIGFNVPYATSGINTSTISLDANRTVAQSTANNAVNTMALNGGATLAATGGVLNQQLSSATSTATASSVVALVVADGTNEAVDGSSISIDGNRTTAQASGNVASNALNVSTLSLTATGAGSSALNGGVATAPEGTNSTYGVLNAQGNSGDVTATVTAVNYGGIFAGSTVTSPVVDASSLTLNGNSVGASAVGNSASNSLTLAALNYGTSSAAIGNEQGNTADITATITEARLVLNPIGGVGASTLSAVGNTISSSAVGNSVVTTLTRN